MVSTWSPKKGPQAAEGPGEACLKWRIWYGLDKNTSRKPTMQKHPATHRPIAATPATVAEAAMVPSDQVTDTAGGSGVLS